MNRYQRLTEKHRREAREFPHIRANTTEEIDKTLDELFGIEAVGIKRRGIRSIPGMTEIDDGIFVRDEDLKALRELDAKQRRELAVEIERDTTGTHFIYDMWETELERHDPLHTGKVRGDLLENLDMEWEDVAENEALLRGLCLAMSDLGIQEIKIIRL